MALLSGLLRGRLPHPANQPDAHGAEATRCLRPERYVCWATGLAEAASLGAGVSSVWICTLAGELERRVNASRPKWVTVTEPGDFRVLADLRATAKRLELDLEVRTDPRSLRRSSLTRGPVKGNL